MDSNDWQWQPNASPGNTFNGSLCWIALVYDVRCSLYSSRRITQYLFFRSGVRCALPLSVCTHRFRCLSNLNENKNPKKESGIWKDAPARPLARQTTHPQKFYKLNMKSGQTTDNRHPPFSRHHIACVFPSGFLGMANTSDAVLWLKTQKKKYVYLCMRKWKLWENITDYLFFASLELMDSLFLLRSPFLSLFVFIVLFSLFGRRLSSGSRVWASVRKKCTQNKIFSNFGGIL